MSLAGSGKTVLMYRLNECFRYETRLTLIRSSIIDTLAESTLGRDITLPLAPCQDLADGKITSLASAITYHYCEFSDLRSIEPTIILGTLIRQLLETVAIPDTLCQRIERCLTPRARQATPEELLAILENTLLQFSKTYMLIDGLDECNSKDTHLILSILDKLLQPESGRSVLKVIIFSRHIDLVSRCLTSYTSLEVSIHKISLDINSFIEETVQSKISCGDLEVSDMLLKREIIATLKEGAHGMYV